MSKNIMVIFTIFVATTLLTINSAYAGTEVEEDEEKPITISTPNPQEQAKIKQLETEKLNLQNELNLLKAQQQKLQQQQEQIQQTQQQDKELKLIVGSSIIPIDPTTKLNLNLPTNKIIIEPITGGTPAPPATTTGAITK
jgi:small-conductance mechanosensitive channel